MQNISNLLDSMRMEGISVSVVDGRLKVEPAGLLTDKIRSSIKDNRQELIAALLMGGMSGGDQVLETERAILRCPNRDQINSLLAPKGVGGKSDGQKNEPLNPGTARDCLLCGVQLDQDGGDCWHRAFHLGEESPKVDCPNPPPKIGTATSSPESEKATAGPRRDDQAPGILPQARERINVVAVTWLRENRQELKRHGWTMRELYRRNISPGILFSPIWEKPFLKTTLLDHGDIEFEFVDAGRDCINLARPMPQREIKSRRIES